MKCPANTTQAGKASLGFFNFGPGPISPFAGRWWDTGPILFMGQGIAKRSLAITLALVRGSLHPCPLAGVCENNRGHSIYSHKISGGNQMFMILFAMLIPGLLIAETTVKDREIPRDQWVYSVQESTSIVKTISASVTVPPSTPSDMSDEWTETMKPTPKSIKTPSAPKGIEVGDYIWVYLPKDNTIPAHEINNYVRNGIEQVKGKGYEIVKSPEVDGDPYVFVYTGTK